jgi:hypothetical protein
MRGAQKAFKKLQHPPEGSLERYDAATPVEIWFQDEAQWGRKVRSVMCGQDLPKVPSGEAGMEWQGEGLVRFSAADSVR